MHCLVLDQLLNQRGRRVPADAAQVKKPHVKPGRKHVLHLDIERLQALVCLQVRQHVGTHVHQKTKAFRKCTETLQQTPTRRNCRAAVAHLGHCLIGRTDGGGEMGLGQLGLLGIGDKLLAHQQPHITPLMQRGAGIPARHTACPAAALNLADLRVNDGLQLFQGSAQDARRQGLFLLTQGGLEPLTGRAHRLHNIGQDAIG